MESPLVRAPQERLAKMVLQEGKLIGGNSRSHDVGLVARRCRHAGRRVDGGYRITGRKPSPR